MKKRKTQKRINMKSSLMVLMLLAVFLVISTYAWFTSNKLVKVNSLNVNVQASEGFQISLDGINWKSVIQAADIMGQLVNETYTGNTNYVAEEMLPVSTAKLTDGDTGYMNMFLGSVVTDEQTGEYVLSASAIPENDTDSRSYTSFDLFFKTNNDILLSLEKEAGVFDIAPDGSSAKGKGMENSARIAFVKQGEITQVQNANPTGQQIQDLIATTTDGSNVVLWEPNSDSASHTSLAKTEIFNMYGILTSDPIWNSRIAYGGIKKEIDEATPVKLIENNSTANAGVNEEYFEPVISEIATAKARVASTSTTIVLKAGITKIRVYMWLEGQDYDCGDSASGSNIKFDLILTATKEEPAPDPEP